MLLGKCSVLPGTPSVFTDTTVTLHISVKKMQKVNSSLYNNPHPILKLWKIPPYIICKANNIQTVSFPDPIPNSSMLIQILS